MVVLIGWFVIHWLIEWMNEWLIKILTLYEFPGEDHSISQIARRGFLGESGECQFQEPSQGQQSVAEGRHGWTDKEIIFLRTSIKYSNQKKYFEKYSNICGQNIPRTLETAVQMDCARKCVPAAAGQRSPDWRICSRSRRLSRAWIISKIYNSVLVCS